MDCVRVQFYRTMCDKPQATWVRRFGAISNQAPSTSRTRPTCDPSSELSLPPTLTPIPTPSDNGRSPSKLLRGMFSLSGADSPDTRNSHLAIISEIAIVGFFFATRSCEITTTPAPGRTKILDIAGVVFRDKANHVTLHSSPELCKAERVTVTFRFQKNGNKDDKRTHQRTLDPVMCPVPRLASIVCRINRLLPTAPPPQHLHQHYPGARVLLRSPAQ